MDGLHQLEVVILLLMVVLALTTLAQRMMISLAPVIRVFNLEADRSLEGEERRAREQAAAAALVRLEELADAEWPVAEQLDEMRVHYGRRAQRYSGNGPDDASCTPEEASAFRRLRHETLTAERVAVIRLRNEGVISDEVLHRLEHELDVEALRHGLGERRLSTDGTV